MSRRARHIEITSPLGERKEVFEHHTRIPVEVVPTQDCRIDDGRNILRSCAFRFRLGC